MPRGGFFYCTYFGKRCKYCKKSQQLVLQAWLYKYISTQMIEYVLEKKRQMELYECLAAIKRRLWLVAAAAVLAAAAAWAASAYLMDSVYKSTATIIIVNKPGAPSNTGGNAQPNMLLDSNTIRVYANLAESDSVTESIMGRLNLAGTVDKVKEQIGVSADYDTGIIKISVSANSAGQSRDIAQAFIESLKGQSDKLSLGADIRMIDAPKVPEQPSSPNLPLNVLLATAGGIFAGLLLALYYGAAEASTDEIAALQRFPMLRVLGLMPRIRTAGKKASPALVRQGSNPPNESLKVIRTNLLFLMECGSVKTVMVTSPGPAEGKTTFAINLAMSMAQVQKRTLVVECNARKPALRRIGNQPGGKLPAMQPELKAAGDCLLCSLPSLGIDTAPEFMSSPVGQLDAIGSPRMRAFLEEMERNYDLILLDGAPLLPYADALMLSRLVQGVILVADYSRLAYAVLDKCLRRLGQIEANILGVVVNNMPPARILH